jgi:hypothetical protein
MKQLDPFSRFEKGVYKIGAYFTVFGAPVLVWLLAERVLLKELPPLIRYPLAAAFAIVGMFIVLFLAIPVENFFDGLRKRLGMKPLHELTEEIGEQRAGAEFAEEERERGRFTDCPESEQRYKLWALQQRQLTLLTEIHAGINFIRFLLVSFLVGYVALRFF